MQTKGVPSGLVELVLVLVHGHPEHLLEAVAHSILHRLTSNLVYLVHRACFQLTSTPDI